MKKDSKSGGKIQKVIEVMCQTPNQDTCFGIIHLSQKAYAIFIMHCTLVHCLCFLYDSLYKKVWRSLFKKFEGYTWTKLTWFFFRSISWKLSKYGTWKEKKEKGSNNNQNYKIKILLYDWSESLANSAILNYLDLGLLEQYLEVNEVEEWNIWTNESIIINTEN